MSSATTERNFVLPSIMLLVALVGFVIAFLGWQKYTAEQRLRVYLPTTATVTHSKSAEQYSRGYGRRSYGRWHWVTTIDFSYPGTDAIVHQGTTYVEASSAHPEWGDGQTMDKGYWAPGRTFTVFVNPSDGSQWSMIDRPQVTTMLQLGGGIFLSLLGTLMFYPMLIKLFGSEPEIDYIPPDDPRALSRDSRLRL